MRASNLVKAMAVSLAVLGCEPLPSVGPPAPLPAEPWNPFRVFEVAEAPMQTGLGFEPVTGALREACDAPRVPTQLLTNSLLRFRRSAATTVTGEPRFAGLLQPLALDLVPTCDALGVCRVVLIPGSLDTVRWVTGTMTGDRTNAGCFQSRGAEGFLQACGTHSVFSQTLGGLIGVAVEVAGLDERERAAFEALASKRVGGSLPFLLVHQVLEGAPQATVRTTLGTVGLPFPQGVQRTRPALADGFDLIRVLDQNFWSERRREALTSPAYGSLLERALQPQRDCDGQSLPFNDGEFNAYANALELLVDLRDGRNIYGASKAAGTQRFLACSQWAADQAPLCRAAIGAATRSTACELKPGCDPYDTARD